MPAYCVNPTDYRNVLIDFKYTGTVSDRSIINTNLNGFGIRIKDESGQAVLINQHAGKIYNSMKFMADLVRFTGQKAEAGEIDTSVTIVLTLR